MKDFYPLHDVRCDDKVTNLVDNFDSEKSRPILALECGKLINGTHRYSALIKRMELGYTENFEVIEIIDYPNCWVIEAINDLLLTQDDTMYIDIDWFWHENYIFSEHYENKQIKD